MIVRLTPPAYEAVSMKEVKAHLRLDHTHEDTYIRGLISTATDMLQESLNLSFMAQTWLYRVKPIQNPAEDFQRVSLPRGPAIRIISAHSVLPKRTHLKRVTLEEESGISKMVVYGQHEMVEVEYQAGFGPKPNHIPSPLRQAVVCMVGEMFERREQSFLTPQSYIYELIQPYARRRMA